MTQRREFRLPDVGEGLTEADIVSWRVKPGDTVQINQIIVDIETAKAVVELPCPFEGTVAGLLAAEGDTVDVGTPIIAVDVAGDDGAASRTVDPAAIAAEGPRPAADDLLPPLPPEATGQPAPAAPAEERQAVLVGYGVKASATTRRQRKTPAGDGRSISGSAGRSGAAAANGGGRPATVLAKPLVRKLARDLGVDLAGLAGTGRPARSPGTTCSGPRAARRWPRYRTWAPRPGRRSASRSAGCASTPRPRWRPARSPRRT